MDAVEFLKTYRRLCASFSSGRFNDCLDCPLHTIGHCGSMKHSDPSKIVPIVEQWAKKHPIKTRQSEFLKMFPNACLSPRGVIAICPYDIDTSFSCTLRENVETHVLQNPCIKCRCEYWLHDGE